jgi:hypothetical protein
MAEPIDRADLARFWVHSREEDTATTSVYRPAGYPLPPARGRKGFELKPDGSAVESGPGATDRTQRTSGTWRLTGNCLELDFPGGEAPRALVIETVEPDRLVVRKAPAACPPQGGGG